MGSSGKKERGILAARGGKGKWLGLPLYCRHALSRRFFEAAVRGTANPHRFRPEPRGPPARGGPARHGVGGRRDLEPLATRVRAHLLVAERRSGAGALR